MLGASSAPTAPAPVVTPISPGIIVTPPATAIPMSSSLPPTYDSLPAALFAASSLACYFDVPYSSLLLLLGAASMAYSVYQYGTSQIRWWVWALAALAVYMYAAGPCSGQLMGDYERGAALLGY